MTGKPFLRCAIGLQKFRMAPVGSVAIQQGGVEAARPNLFRPSGCGSDLGPSLGFVPGEVKPGPLGLGDDRRGPGQGENRCANGGDRLGQSASSMRRRT